MAQQPQNPGVNYAYVDAPEISETFADSIQGVLFDGQTLRITFVVNRMDPPNPPNPTTGKRYPVCRLVLTPSGIGELMNQLNQLNAAMAQASTKSGPDRAN
jgi:hypothetical protein